MIKKIRTNTLIYVSLLTLLMVTACQSGMMKVTNSVILGNSTLTWDSPTTYTNGKPLSVYGYKIYYRTVSGRYGDRVIDVKLRDKAMTRDVSSRFKGTSGTYYFVVTAYDQWNNESEYSNETSKYIIIP